VASFVQNLLAAPYLSLIFSERKVKISKFFQELIHQDNSSLYFLIIDINHNWSAVDLTEATRIVQPDSLDDLLDTITAIEQLISPRVKAVIIDSLPLYFRDFRNGDVYGMQNLRTYSFCLSLLKRVAKHIPVLVSSFPNGMYPQQPLMVDISRYYCDYIYRLSYSQSYELQAI
jgi:hypothetical protein